MQIVERNINELIEAEYNPRQLTAAQFEQIKSSVQRFGFVDPVIVNTHKDRRNIIVGGHQRVKVARALGIAEVPTVEVKLDAAKERELNIRLNKNTGEWDWDALANHFDVGELVEWGFSEEELTGFSTAAFGGDDDGQTAYVESQSGAARISISATLTCPAGIEEETRSRIQSLANDKVKVFLS
jgi:hypothetical protein